VRSASSFSAGLNSTALATGESTTTSTAATTAAWSGSASGAAIAYGTAVAVAEAPGIPHASAATDGFAYGGTTSTSHTATWSLNFADGTTHTSVDVSVTAASTYGQNDSLAGHGLTSPSLHGLF